MLLSKAKLQSLLRFLTDSETVATPLAERRERLVQQLATWVDGDFGFWSWGYGMPLDSTITPVAAIPVGITPEQWARTHEFSLSEDTVRLFNAPIKTLLNERPHATVSRSQLWTDEQWYGDRYVTDAIHKMGWDNWLISVHYFASDTWTSLTFFRALGKPDFIATDLEIVELALGSVEWMQPKVSESIPPETFVDLSPRMRAVMLMLLDGQSRKQIATGLGVTLHIVNDHCKEIYQRFHVNSATELAARFLKST